MSNFSLETSMPNLVFLSCSSFQVLKKNSRRGYFQLPNFQPNSLHKNCINSRSSNDIGMRLGPVTKFDEKNTIASKKNYDSVSANYEATLIFSICGQFEVIWKADSGRMPYNSWIFSDKILIYIYNINWKQN